MRGEARREGANRASVLSGSQEDSTRQFPPGTATEGSGTRAGCQGPRRPLEALHLTCVHVHGYTFELFGVLIKALKNKVLGGSPLPNAAGRRSHMTPGRGPAWGGVTWGCFQGPECGGSLIPAVVPRGGLRKSALCVRRAPLGEFTRPQPLHGPSSRAGQSAGTMEADQIQGQGFPEVQVQCKGGRALQDQ